MQVWCRDNATLPLPYIDRSTIYLEPESLESETYYYVLYISGLVLAGACPSPALPSNSLGMQR